MMYFDDSPWHGCVWPEQVCDNTPTDVQENENESRLAWFSIVFFLVMNPVTNALIIAKRLFM
jgi:hypothetical protein